MGEPKPESNYFFHKSLKDIWKNSEKPLFSLVGNDDHNETDNPPSSSKSASNSNAVSEKTCNDLGENSQKLNFVDLRSWKESFFFTPNDDRLKDGVMFFKGDNEKDIDYDEVRKKLKQSIRHKLLKRRSLGVKRKFNKRNFKSFMYKKIK